jgi:hypothetical protein
MSHKNTAVFGIYPTRDSAEAAVDTLRTKGYFGNTDRPTALGSVEPVAEKVTK